MTGCRKKSCYVRELATTDIFCFGENNIKRSTCFKLSVTLYIMHASYHYKVC